MNSEPSYLASLGEFATLKNTIGSWYHQDAYLDFESDEEIWQSIWANSDDSERSRLLAQLASLLSRSDSEVLAVWNSESHAHFYTDAAEAREFLGSMLSFFGSQR